MLKTAKYPEEVGVSSDSIKKLIEYTEEIGYRTDSIVVVRDEQIACQCHWYPNSADIPHDMFSLSKSITATAMGIAWDEGYISLDTKIYPTYFPHKLDKLKGKQRQRAEKLTIFDVITMRAGKVTSVFDNKEKNDWLDTFIDTKIQYTPGDDWKYISENAYLLSWILQKETGMTMTEFLTPRLYEPLGIEVPHWEQSHIGVDAGGWGLKLTANDLTKIAVLYLNKGAYNGKRIFSEEWFKLATTPYTKKTYPVFTDNTDYGFQLWIDHETDEETYRFTGLYGQFIFLFPRENAAVIVTASDNRDESMIKKVYELFPKGFIEKTKSKNSEEFAEYLNSKKIKLNFKNPCARNYKKEKEINNRLIKLVPAANLSTLSATTYFMWSKRIGSLNNIKFNFDTDSVAFSFTEKNCSRTVINAGMNGQFIRNNVVLADNPVIFDAAASWNKDGTLELYLYSTGRAQKKRLFFSFNGNRVTIVAKSDPGYGDMAKFNLEFNMGLRVGNTIGKIIDIGAPVFETFYSDMGSFGFFAE